MKETIEESTSLLSVTTAVEAILASLNTCFPGLLSGSLSGGWASAALRYGPAAGVRSTGSINIRFKEPAMDTAATISRIKQVLESFPQPGPVEQLGIKITRMGCCSGKQKKLFPEVRGRDQLMEILNSLI